jgi:hypothetical protein
VRLGTTPISLMVKAEEDRRSREPTKLSRSEAVQASQRLYEGTFVVDRAFWMTTCLRRHAPNMCKLVSYERNRTAWTIRSADEEQMATATRWVPSTPYQDCPFKYYSHNATLTLLRDMGIDNIHLIGDSMSRYVKDSGDP